MKLTYLFIRMWAPATESSDVDNAHYVAMVEREDSVQWTLTRDFEEAKFFKKPKTAERVVRCVRRIADRIKRGWLFEIIQVDEVIVGTNVPQKGKKSA